MEPRETIEGFATLFQGREDAYGTEDGGCARQTAYEPGVDWLLRVEAHLRGASAPIGVYPLVHTSGQVNEGVSWDAWRVKWGCVDFDIQTEDKPAGDYANEAYAADACARLERVLNVAYGVRGWTEITRSRGRHLWVFARDWVPASDMRRALLVASEIAETTVREVNPKQESLPEGALGNYVRLPYPDSLEYGHPPMNDYRRCIANGNEVLDLPDFVGEALDARVPEITLARIAEHYVPPPPPLVLDEFDAPVCDGRLTRQLGPLAWTIFQEGPLPGKDRSGTLYRLAHLCKDDGLAPEDALAVVSAADEAWGKFHKRADGSQRLRQLVGSAYRDWEDA